MSELETLIRVRRHEIEQQQKGLAVMYKKADALQNEHDSYVTQLHIESEKAKDMDAALLSYFVPYKESMKRKIFDVEDAQENLERMIRQAQDMMRDMFTEMKKIEIIDERRKAEILAEIAKKEDDFLSEIALDGFARQKDQ